MQNIQQKGLSQRVGRLSGDRLGVFLKANHNYFYFNNLKQIRIVVRRSSFVFVGGGLRGAEYFWLDSCKNPTSRAKKPREKWGTHPTLMNYLFESTKSTVALPLPVTVTDFSHVLGWVKTGRCTLCSVSTS